MQVANRKSWNCSKSAFSRLFLHEYFQCVILLGHSIIFL